ncbi:Uncharacterised protein [Mycobacteroides abscessus subsp. abscessus]|nr:Uncharacterised protein [Mycobacteroides abscessus subsp. abscessus]SKU99479.1 Uncharacterised protein [Mycobacteroides abscessus subsp. abscessus]SKW63766.1 Uncharacterised protein [Mycobacteroides abscessus subsp. abscessus]
MYSRSRSPKSATIRSRNSSRSLPSASISAALMVISLLVIVYLLGSRG